MLHVRQGSRTRNAGASRDCAHRHHRHGAGHGLRGRIPGAPAAPAAPCRLPAGRRRRRPVHARFRRRRGPRGSAGRNRRHPADVRCRPPFLDPRPDGGAQDRYPRRHRADRGWHRAGLRDRHRVGLVIRCRAGIRPSPVGRQHCRPAAGSGRAQPARFGQWPDRRRLADRRGPCHGPGAGPSAGAGRRAGRQHPRGGRTHWRPEPGPDARPDPGQSRSFPWPGADRR